MKYPRKEETVQTVSTESPETAEQEDSPIQASRETSLAEKGTLQKVEESPVPVKASGSTEKMAPKASGFPKNAQVVTTGRPFIQGSVGRSGTEILSVQGKEADSAHKRRAG